MYLKKIIFGFIAGFSFLTALGQSGINRIIIVSGAGDASANITYIQNDSTSANNRFYSIIGCNGNGFDASAYQIQKNGNHWNINDSTGTTLYTASSDSLRPPGTGWQVVNGTAPAPTLAGYVYDELTTWNGNAWSNGVPNDLKDALINSSTSPGSFSANNLFLKGATLNIANGDTVDISGNISVRTSISRSATLNNFTLNGNSSNWVSGAGSTFNGSASPANGLNFDGSDDYTSEVDHVDFNFTTGLTIEAWVNADALTNHSALVSKFSNGNREFSLLLLSSGIMEYSISFDGSTEQFFSGSTTLTSGNWYHIAFTYDGSTMRAFVNGNTDGTHSVSGTIHNGTVPLTIGARSEGSITRYFDGTMDEVRIWNTTRTQPQIQAAMNSELSGNESHLVAYYNFNQGTAGGSNAGLNSLTNNTDPPVESSNKITGLGTLIFSGEDQELTDVSINFEGIVQVNSGTTLQTNDSITLTASSASSYGQIIGDGSVLGNVTSQAYLDVSNARYHYLGSPFTDATLEEFNEGQSMVAANSSQGTVWQWNASNAAWEAPSALTNVAVNGQGYALYAGTNAYGTFLLNGNGVSELNGTVAAGNVAVPLGYNNGQSASVGFVGGTSQGDTEGWNLLSNPYPSQYDWDGQTLPAGMSNAFYVNKGGSYASYVSGVGTNDGTRYLAPFQGFWVQTANSSPGTFTFAQAQRVTAHTTPLMKTSVLDGVYLNLSDGIAEDEVYIGYDQGATNNFDAHLDAHKLLNSEAPNLYVTLSGESYSICRVPHHGARSFPLSVNNLTNGQAYTVQLDASHLNTYQTVTLEDLLLNVNYDLLHASPYTFTHNDAFRAERFILHFAKKAISVNQAETPMQAYAYVSEHGIIFDPGTTPNLKVEVYNMAGQLVDKKDDVHRSTLFRVGHRGVYILRLENDKFRKSLKVVY
ncbi:MAG: LamG-like jellyroll fold domain-containing protein [Owenweeksia sp.]